MLHFGMKPPFSYSDFLERCRQEIDADGIDTLERVSIESSIDIKDKLPVLETWKNFNRRLRNELARTRAVKKGKDPNKYLRGSN